MKVNDYINSKYSEESSDCNPYDLEDSEKADIRAHGYASGLTHGLEIAVGFAEYLRLNYHLGENHYFWHPNTGTGIRYTSEQIFSKYLDTLKTK